MRALLVIDVQHDYFTDPHKITYPAGSYANILRAIDVANAAGVPVFLIQHTIPEVNNPTWMRRNTHGWEIPVEVLARPHAAVIEKHWPGSFTDTPLYDILRARSVDTVVIAGYMTQMCCDTTARQACHMGFQVEFLSDATGTLDVSNAAGSVTAEELHRAILVTQAMRFSTVLTVEEWAARLAHT